MYIEFTLPTVASGASAQQANYIIRQELETWANKYQIVYRAKNIKYSLRITFDNDAHYDLFAMTWNRNRQHHALSRWCLIEPMKRGDGK